MAQQRYSAETQSKQQRIKNKEVNVINETNKQTNGSNPKLRNMKQTLHCMMAFIPPLPPWKVGCLALFIKSCSVCMWRRAVPVFPTPLPRGG